jgi:hypothetical protein
VESAITESTEVSILDRVLRAATIEEIEAEQELLRAKIEQVKATSALTISQTKNSIDALEVIRKALVIQRDGKLPAREKPEGEVKVRRKRRGPGGGESTADQCEALIRRNGPMSLKQLEQATGRSYAAVYSALNCDRFEVDPSTKLYSVAGAFE